MNQPRQRRIAQSVAAIASSALWGLLEVIALARSRWVLRHERFVASRGQRG